MHAPDPSSCHEPRHEVMILVILVLVVLARARPTQCYSHQHPVCGLVRHTVRCSETNGHPCPGTTWYGGVTLYGPCSPL